MNDENDEVEAGNISTYLKKSKLLDNYRWVQGSLKRVGEWSNWKARFRSRKSWNSKLNCDLDLIC